jgi:tRNA threonylcarbamoyladenosine biosynthesis protein TsaE
MEKVAKAQLKGVAERALALLRERNVKGHATLLTLEGDLGAGKTTFVQALAQALGVEETVQSPTYVLMKSYKLSDKQFERLVHIDAYRLSDASEFEALNPSEFLLDEKALVVVEWPERIEGALPESDLKLRFSAEDTGDGERYIEGV